MNNTILLKKEPRIEFQLVANGFHITDKKAEANNGFYPYGDLQSIELNSIWYPRLAKYLRAFTWILNGVPIFPDSETCKKASVIMHFSNQKVAIWLTDSYMTDKAKLLKELLDKKTRYLSNT